MEELKPCPFCGSKAQTEYMPSRKQWFAVCSNDLCRSSSANWSTEKRAINEWNKRIPPATAPDYDGYIHSIHGGNATASKGVDVVKLAHKLLQLDCGKILEAQDEEFKNKLFENKMMKNQYLKKATAIKEAMEKGDV
jgi:hypothetical protein